MTQNKKSIILEQLLKCSREFVCDDLGKVIDIVERSDYDADIRKSDKAVARLYSDSKSLIEIKRKNWPDVLSQFHYVAWKTSGGNSDCVAISQIIFSVSFIYLSSCIYNGYFPNHLGEYVVKSVPYICSVRENENVIHSIAYSIDILISSVEQFYAHSIDCDGLIIVCDEVRSLLD